jgi:predicted Zn-dependent peptidase
MRPNNAILVLTGDIDMATARPLVEKYFGDIPAGPRSSPSSPGRHPARPHPPRNDRSGRHHAPVAHLVGAGHQ